MQPSVPRLDTEGRADDPGGALSRGRSLPVPRIAGRRQGLGPQARAGSSGPRRESPRHKGLPGRRHRGPTRRFPGQRRQRCRRVLRPNPRILPFGHPGDGVQRQPESHGRVTGDQPQSLVVPEEPGTAPPADVPTWATGDLERQRVTYHLSQTPLEDAGQPLAFLGILPIRRGGRHVGGQASLLPRVVEQILIGREHMPRIDTQLTGQAPDQLRGLGRAVAVILGFVRDERVVLPQRHPVLAPVGREGPARQGFARIPLALAVMQQGSRSHPGPESLQQRGGQHPLGRRDRREIPFGTLRVVDGHECRFAAHGQADIPGPQLLVDPVTQRLDPGPLFLRIGPGDPG